MELIELHILQSFPVSCLNRDDLGSPKAATFGGTRRARVSSQCLKRSQRELFREFAPDYGKGMRTKLLADNLCRTLTEKGYQGDASALANELSAIWSKADKKKTNEGNDKATTLVYLSPAEIEAMADAALAALAENPKAKGKDMEKALKKAIAGVACKGAADIALFGRMVANDPSLNIDAAAMYTHALSTHRAEAELDFYTAMDDLQPEDESGAGMTGVLEYNSACYYRYIAVNVDLLRQNMEGISGETLQTVLRAFVRSALMSVPHARQNSMNAATLPSFVLGLHRATGHPLQLVNAFEEPVNAGSKGYLAESQKKLLAEFETMKSVWGLTPEVAVQLPEKNVTDFITTLTQPLA